jgi:hypothetical protein
MAKHKYLRGDPDRPFPKDWKAIAELEKSFIGTTHEPLWFYRNRGGSTPHMIKLASTYQSPENIDILEKMGITFMTRAHFFKGAGLVRERKSIEKTIAYAKELHKRGIRISVYIGGTMFTDYFFKEVPDAINWARRDQDNQPVTYGGYQLQRWFPCLNNPNYRAYVKKVLDVAVDEVDADEIFFDNQILRHEPRSCRCNFCIAKLREMIKRKYTLDECEERYGFREYPDVMPPQFSQANKPWRYDAIKTPQVQDWIDSRVESVLDFYRDMASYVKSKKTDCTVGMNIKGIHGHNGAFNHGISHGLMADVIDWSCIDGYQPGVKNGAIVTEMRFLKQSHSSHISVVDNGGGELGLVEQQVCNYRKKIEGHGWLGDMEDIAPSSPLTQFLRGNQRLYFEREHLHDVAVLRSEPSTNYNCAKVHEQLMAFEQTLAIEKIPWGIIFDKQIDQLSKYRILALPEIQALSGRWLDALDSFLRAGGGVLASGKAAQCDHWYRERESKDGLARWLGQVPGKQYLKANVGAGRIVYVPEWDVATRWDISDWFMIWGANVLPVKDRALFQRAIEDAAGERPLSHRITGNDQVLVEGIFAKDGVDLHFMNYIPENTTPVMTVKVPLPQGKRGAEVWLTDPHTPEHKRWKVDSNVSGGSVEFSMYTPKVYGLAQVTFK